MDCLVLIPDRDLVTYSNKAEQRTPLRVQRIVSIPERDLRFYLCLFLIILIDLMNEVNNQTPN